jgi:type II secretory pathway pseudopilin PulG
MLGMDKKLNRGDTLIEVLFAISIFSLVVVGSISIMNQGVNASQRSLEITLVRNEIDAQAEALRFMNSSYISAYNPDYTIERYSEDTPAGQWVKMSSLIDVNSDISSFGSASKCEIPSSPHTPFIINPYLAEFVSAADAVFSPAKTFSKIEYNDDLSIISTNWLWVEAIKSNNTEDKNSDYIDFHIRACWNAAGQKNPATIGTIVRLYEPKPKS